MRYRTAISLSLLLGLLIGSLLCACSNSEGVDYTNYAEIADDNDVSSDGDYPQTQDASSSSKVIDYLPLDDTEYPYAGIPRIVIETENFREIKDRETEIPAKLQIWGERAPESEVMDLTIRGRGNTSWGMPQKSYKIEFVNKQAMLGMPKDRDWALISNYADKTLMKNYLMYHLSAKLGAYYAPRCEFAELYLNKEYLGVYLLTETIKIGEERIPLFKNNNSYLVEIDAKHQINEQVFFSNILSQDSIGKAFRIHAPQNATEDIVLKIKEHIQKFETFLKTVSIQKENHINQWIDIVEYVKYYWIQEFSKNPDANFHGSIFFSWQEDDVIRMGPVWDFDIAFGSYNNESINDPQNWHIRYSYWNNFIFQDSIMNYSRINFWKKNKTIFENVLSTIDSTSKFLHNSAQNNFKKWHILQSTDLLYHRHSYSTYKNATDDLKKWIKQRLAWINSKIN